MSEFWKELKEEVESAVDECKFCLKNEGQERGSHFCGERWLPCAHVIARGQCEMLNNHSEVKDG
jgi:hypothetical protein